MYNCELGWPSDDDYVTILNNFFDEYTVFHSLATIEGIYIISIPEKVIPILLKKWVSKNAKQRDIFFKKLKKWIERVLDVDKEGVKLQTGIKVGKYHIKDGKSYINFANSRISNLAERNRLFDVDFFTWDMLINPRVACVFSFALTRINGRCIVNEENYNKYKEVFNKNK